MLLPLFLHSTCCWPHQMLLDGELSLRSLCRRMNLSLSTVGRWVGKVKQDLRSRNLSAAILVLSNGYQDESEGRLFVHLLNSNSTFELMSWKEERDILRETHFSISGTVNFGLCQHSMKLVQVVLHRLFSYHGPQKWNVQPRFEVPMSIPPHDYILGTWQLAPTYSR